MTTKICPACNRELEATKEVQTIVTCTEFDNSLVDYDYLDININDIKKKLRRENV